MKLSIVIPYFNRKPLLLTVLKSFNINYPVEVVIVDDGSSQEHHVDDIINDYDFGIKLIKLEPKIQWRVPVMAANIGFKEATGDVILVNGSEVVHIGDIIGYVFNNFKSDDYFAFSACMGRKPTDIKYDDPDFLKKIQEENAWWGVHSTIGNSIPYCAAISKENMDILGGYDSRFVGGVGFEDYDFTNRVKNLGLEISIIDNPFCFHQYHESVKYPNNKNLELLKYLNEHEPDRIKAMGKS